MPVIPEDHQAIRDLRAAGYTPVTLEDAVRDLSVDEGIATELAWFILIGEIGAASDVSPAEDRAILGVRDAIRALREAGYRPSSVGEAVANLHELDGIDRDACCFVLTGVGDLVDLAKAPPRVLRTLL